LDIESVSDQGLHCLLGLLVCQGEIVTYHPFWANKADDVESIWQAFFALANQYPAAPIYHYGSYEPRTIAKLARQYATDSENLTKRLINVHKQIYGKVYFPVYSNRLKDVARFTGFTWTHPDASGLQSIVWRYKWNETHENQYNVILYRILDCDNVVSITKKWDCHLTQQHVF
jgi:predicted RecB family nuclease